MGLRRDHIVPRFYLKGFTSTPRARRKPCIHVFDRKQGRCYPRSPEKVWRIANYYDIKGPDGEPDDRLDRINREIESKAASLFKPDGFIERRTKPTDGERSLLAWFAGMLQVRAPDLHSIMADALRQTAGHMLRLARQHCIDRTQSFAPAVRSIEAQIGVTITGASPEDLQGAEIEVDEDRIKVAAFMNVKATETLFRRMPWTIFEAQGDDVFITSDRPLTRENISPMGDPGFAVPELNVDNFHFILPLTPSVAVVTHLEKNGTDRGIVPATTSIIRAINTEVWMQSERFCFASRQDFPGADRCKVSS